LEETLFAMSRGGVDLEGFAEHDRLAEASPRFPVYHYLRMPERHREKAFDLALYPLGRDASPYQAAAWLMKQFPSVVWLFDSVLHHLALGGIGLMGRWRSYRFLLEEAYGESGAAIAQTVTQNWGTNSVFGRYDLIAEMTKGQSAVVASWPALAQRLRRRLPNQEIPVASLPLIDDPANWRGDDVSDAPGSLTVIVSLSSSNPAATVAAAAAVLGTDHPKNITFCTSTFAYANGAEDAARRQAIHDRIDWILDPSQELMTQITRRAGTVIWLDDDLRADGRALLMHGLAAGKMTLVPRSELYGDIPEGVVAKVDPGHSMGPEISAYMAALSSNTALRLGMQEAALDFAERAPNVERAAADLREILESLVNPAGLRMSPISERVWKALHQDLSTHVVPAAATVPTRRLLLETIRDLAKQPSRDGHEEDAQKEGAVPE
jgi:hypothetical protein